MTRQSSRYMGVLLCLLYVTQAAVVPLLHIVGHAMAEAAAEVECGVAAAPRHGGPVFEPSCEGSCSRPGHHHHPHARHHGPTTCPVCSSNQPPGICQTAPFPPPSLQGALMAAGLFAIPRGQYHGDSASPRGPPSLL